jgi:hypothetical protein
MLNLMARGCVKVMQHLVGVHVEEDRSVSEHLSAFVLFGASSTVFVLKILQNRSGIATCLTGFSVTWY